MPHPDDQSCIRSQTVRDRSTLMSGREMSWHLAPRTCLSLLACLVLPLVDTDVLPVLHDADTFRDCVAWSGDLRLLFVVALAAHRVLHCWELSQRRTGPLEATNSSGPVGSDALRHRKDAMCVAQLIGYRPIWRTRSRSDHDCQADERVEFLTRRASFVRFRRLVT